ncbi:Putative nicotinamide mononucleotide transporter [Mycobacteroides abscessus subsp. massiliense]|uniref:Nicotinamide mononucleotide transporter PnuC family protein n=1 Tax=Mycobacteroides abscessus subsp. bolletii 1513 TaxID=1299321 RepID=X8DVD4_9MYCO|nr:nicotinamide riboside transporter PnuC [Mycobacteroides abscessus]EUA71515.1 nicotinamide mononucleotide transporter PnuC family protein [Mycobacteroides abscessus subsp. bolletii 1513]AMU76250.1 nicotinamide mononucleotide transporter [Mycobacteroides abscessus]ANN99972.1 nicotinamide mononucleotide transporter [Mycobacteroides abscessus]ANO25195.1 nicotinamide mononucleotide transporter [Mycobacteroides abscessus]EIU07848.1 nicotinamide mononucleotide transporter pnuC [Mycobacteroides abs
MDWTELIGSLSGVLFVILAVRQNIWTFPVAIVSSLFYMVVFGRQTLYADAALQIMFIALAAQGWHLWLRGSQDRHGVTVTRTPRRAWLPLVSCLAALVAGLYAFLVTFTDSNAPQLDSAITGLSVVSQLMMNRKWIENWILWIVTDTFSVGVYLYKGLNLTAGFYAFLSVMAAVGLWSWRKELHAVATTESA